MPLADHLPKIDDRTYADIVAELRSRIDRYAPEWSDHNDNDPGIALLQLFAWLAEFQLFRMGQVPELNYLKFLELVGIELTPARPAAAAVTFPVDPAYAAPTVTVPALTQIAAEGAEGPILFELERALTAVRAPLAAVQSFDGFVFQDLTDTDEAAETGYYPLGRAFGPEAALYLGFAETLPDASLTLTAWAAGAERGSAVVACHDAARFETSRLAWEVWDGREWRGLTLLADGTAALTRTGSVSLRGPKAGLSVARTLGRIDTSLHWLRARATKVAYQAPPRLLALRTNTGAVVQAETLEFESLGGSNGETHQVVRLADAPVLAGSAVIEVDEGQGFLPWTEVDDFAGAGPDDAVFVLNRATGEIRFGDGLSGRVPAGNPARPRNIRARRYRVGGGAMGNVAAGAINALQSAIPGLVEDEIGNLVPAAGGTDEETLAEAKARAPIALKSRDRAVAREDFETLALQAANIARARALPLRHPGYPGIEVPGSVTVIVLPDIDDPAPMPSEGTLNAVCAYLNDRRLLTTELHVTGPDYRAVTVAADVVAEDTADLAALKTELLDSLALYFDPRHGGETSDPTKPAGDPERSGGGWPFGGDIYYSLLYRRLLIPGVRRIERLEITLGRDTAEPCRDVAVPEGVLLTSGDHALDLRYEEEEA